MKLPGIHDVDVSALCRHLKEFESAERAERTLSGHDENVEALPYICVWLWGETDYVSSYDMGWCPQLHVGRPSYSNPCWRQLCQTLGGIYMTEYRGLDEEVTKWKKQKNIG